MGTSIELLESIGANSSIKQFDSVAEMLLQNSMTEQQINTLIDSNIPLVCSWGKEDEKDNEQDDEQDSEDKKINLI